MPDETFDVPPVISKEMQRHAEIAALIDEYCHRLTNAISMDPAIYNAIIFGRDELKRRIAEILKET
jgi:hypothetical protein